MRQSRVAEAQNVSNYSSSPEPQSHICSLIYWIPSPQALSFPTLPVTRRPSLVQTHQDHRFELRLLCVQCWVWSSRPPTTLKQLQFFYYKGKKKTTKALAVPTGHGILTPPSYLREETRVSSTRADAPRHALHGRSLGMLRLSNCGGLLWNCTFLLALVLAFFEHAKVVCVCISWKKSF